MSGHSKWSTIKRQKGAKDAARGAIFTKLGNAIAVAARNGTDPETNFALRLAIDKAKTANMPSVNIQRSIDRVKDKNASELTEVMYEGYGPGGIAVLVSCATDNTNRTLPDVKVAFTRHGGNLADKGSVAYLFEQKGIVRVKDKSDQLVMDALDGGASDVQEEVNESVIYTDPKDLARVRDYLKEKNYEIAEADLTYEPKTPIEINDEETAGKVMRLMDSLDNLDDVTNTYVNFEIPDDIAAKLM